MKERKKRIRDKATQLRPVKVEDSVTEQPSELLGKVAVWASQGIKPDFSSHDGLRHILAESRDRSAMFMAIMAVHRLNRLAKLVGATDQIEERLFNPETIREMDIDQLIFTLRTAEQIQKDAIAFVNGAVVDNTSGAQVLINMVDARQLNLGRGDVPNSRSREAARQAVAALMQQFGGMVNGTIVKSEPAGPQVPLNGNGHVPGGTNGTTPGSGGGSNSH